MANYIENLINSYGAGVEDTAAGVGNTLKGILTLDPNNIGAQGIGNVITGIGKTVASPLYALKGLGGAPAAKPSIASQAGPGVDAYKEVARLMEEQQKINPAKELAVKAVQIATPEAKVMDDYYPEIMYPQETSRGDAQNNVFVDEAPPIMDDYYPELMYPEPARAKEDERKSGEGLEEALKEVVKETPKYDPEVFAIVEKKAEDANDDVDMRPSPYGFKRDEDIGIFDKLVPIGQLEAVRRLNQIFPYFKDVAKQGAAYAIFSPEEKDRENLYARTDAITPTEGSLLNPLNWVKSFNEYDRKKYNAQHGGEAFTPANVKEAFVAGDTPDTGNKYIDYPLAVLGGIGAAAADEGIDLAADYAALAPAFSALMSDPDIARAMNYDLTEGAKSLAKKAADIARNPRGAWSSRGYKLPESYVGEYENPFNPEEPWGEYYKYETPREKITRPSDFTRSVNPVDEFGDLAESAETINKVPEEGLSAYEDIIGKVKPETLEEFKARYKGLTDPVRQYAEEAYGGQGNINMSRRGSQMDLKSAEEQANAFRNAIKATPTDEAVAKVEVTAPEAKAAKAAAESDAAALAEKAVSKEVGDEFKTLEDVYAKYPELKAQTQAEDKAWAMLDDAFARYGFSPEVFEDALVKQPVRAERIPEFINELIYQLPSANSERDLFRIINNLGQRYSTPRSWISESASMENMLKPQELSTAEAPKAIEPKATSVETLAEDAAKAAAEEAAAEKAANAAKNIEQPKAPATEAKAGDQLDLPNTNVGEKPTEGESKLPKKPRGRKAFKKLEQPQDGFLPKELEAVVEKVKAFSDKPALRRQIAEIYNDAIWKGQYPEGITPKEKSDLDAVRRAVAGLDDKQVALFNQMVDEAVGKPAIVQPTSKYETNEMLKDAGKLKAQQDALIKEGVLEKVPNAEEEAVSKAVEATQKTEPK